MNPTLLTDGYKLDHRRQYPEETVKVYSNMTPRKSRIEGIDGVRVFGIQAYCMATLIDLWNNEFFSRKFKDVGDEFYETMQSYLGNAAADAIGVQHWAALHRMGYLPLRIKALPEGRKCPIRVPIFTVTETHPDFFWLTNYIETDMSAETWPTCTSATMANEYFNLFTRWAMKTVGEDSFVPFQGHDFAYRGMFGRQAAIMSGAAHMSSGFVGTDCVPAIGWLKKYYGADPKTEIVGCSVAATEHAVMCVGTGFYIMDKNLTWEKYGEAELAVFKRLITEVYPNGIVSIVSDTWDLWKVLFEYLPQLKDEILARDGKLVIRPDSGDPVDILCGLKDVFKLEGHNNDTGYEIRDYDVHPDNSGWFGDNDYNPEWLILGNRAFKYGKEGYRKTALDQHPELKNFNSMMLEGVVETLWNIFGGTESTAGYKVLDSHIGCIYGDSITIARAEEICSRLEKKGFASTNWVAGIGSYTYQYVTRDTFGFAMKATYAEVATEWLESMPPKPVMSSIKGIEIFKDPKTDDGTKKSARGLIQVSYNTFDKKYEMKDRVSWEEEENSSLDTIFLNGKMVKTFTLSEIRKNART